MNKNQSLVPVPLAPLDAFIAAVMLKHYPASREFPVWVDRHAMIIDLENRLRDMILGECEGTVQLPANWWAPVSSTAQRGLYDLDSSYHQFEECYLWEAIPEDVTYYLDEGL